MSDENDLTLREVREAERLRITPGQYNDLKRSMRRSLQVEMSKELKEGILSQYRAEVETRIRKEERAKIEEELRPALLQDAEKKLVEKPPAALVSKIRAQMLAELQSEVSKKHDDAVRKAMRDQVLLDLKKEAPTEQSSALAREFLQELQIECLALSDAASDKAAKAKKTIKWSQTWRNLLTVGLITLSILGPLLGFIHYGRSTTLFVVGIALLALTAYQVARSSATLKRMQQEIVDDEKASSTYLTFADSALKMKLVELPLFATHTALQDKVTQLLGAKHELDKTFHANSDALAQSRNDVRERFLAEMGTNKFLEVADHHKD